MKTNALTGLTLDWAVAICERLEVCYENNELQLVDDHSWDDDWMCWNPSTNWGIGGIIIENWWISIINKNDYWVAEIEGDNNEQITMQGETPLIAAMRCYVAYKCGDSVKIPALIVKNETRIKGKNNDQF